MSILTEISQNLQKGKAKIVAELVQTSLDEGVAPDAMLNEGLMAGMNIIGEKFKNNEVYVPEEAVASLETYGGNVSKLAPAAGMKYINGKDTVTYFGAVLFDV